MSFRLICHGGSGLSAPFAGRIFGVEPDGTLRYYRYLGDGTADHSGATGWDTHSGNTIGHGWTDFQHILGMGHGVLMGIQNNGDLRWYRYTGDGTQDPAGVLGADANNGNQIGQGWDGFRALFAGPSSIAGADGIDVGYDTLWGVEQNGDPRWYGYGGDGEQDPSGSTGWLPHSRNVIGNASVVAY